MPTTIPTGLLTRRGFLGAATAGAALAGSSLNAA